MSILRKLSKIVLIKILLFLISPSYWFILLFEYFFDKSFKYFKKFNDFTELNQKIINDKIMELLK